MPFIWFVPHQTNGTPCNQACGAQTYLFNRLACREFIEPAFNSFAKFSVERYPAVPSIAFWRRMVLSCLSMLNLFSVERHDSVNYLLFTKD